MFDTRLADEQARHAALMRYEILDSRPEKSFDKITALVCAVLGVPMAAVSLIDRDRQWFKSRCGLEASETPRDISFCTHTIRKRDVMIIADTRLDPRFRDSPLVNSGPQIASYAGVPLVTPDGYNIGALCAMDTVPRAFTPVQIELLQNFAAVVIDELEMRQIIRRDFLTGALSRRAFTAELDREIDRRKLHNRPSALAILDLDHFKSINDSFGHPIGDRVLKAVARTCIAAMRPDDILGRLGGEEFAILLPDILTGAALRVANRIRTAIADLVVDAGLPLTITASFGVAPLNDSITSAAEWLSRADDPLYVAKRNGRNCCATTDDATTLHHAVVARV